MDGNNVKNDDKNGQLSCRIYSSPAVARLFFVKVGSIARSLRRFKILLGEFHVCNCDARYYILIQSDKHNTFNFFYCNRKIVTCRFISANKPLNNENRNDHKIILRKDTTHVSSAPMCGVFSPNNFMIVPIFVVQPFVCRNKRHITLPLLQ